jgi:deazaflavin-dependent oxidoreductase (nitroreductase family)
MVEKVSELKPPKGIRKALFRAPLWMYRLHLGPLLGDRFLKLTHTGRSSGKPRHVVLEVVKHDREKGVYYIAAAWGEKSDWVKNIRANPQVKVQVGSREFDMLAEELSPDLGEQVILDYAQRHPTAMINLARFMGYQLDGSQADFRELGRRLMLFSLSPGSQGS